MDFNSMLSQLKRNAATVAVSSSTTTTSSTSAATHNTSSSTNISPPPTKRTKTTTATNDTNTKHKQSTTSVPKTPIQKIYLICPPHVQTGGPEAMHQLCHVLNTHHPQSVVEAKMLYLREDRGCVDIVRGARRLDVYGWYDAPSSEFWPGEEEEAENEEGYHPNSDSTQEAKEQYSTDLVIWPECWTHLMETLPLCSSDKKPQMAIWWLSVDNNNSRYNTWYRNDILHLYQSEYAKQYITSNGALNVMPMTEFIPDHHRRQRTMMRFDEEEEEGTKKKKEGQEQQVASRREFDVVYNPLKGIHYTDEILKRSGKVFKFRPIGGGVDGRVRISPEEVTTLLHNSKIYIDFGPHPGMDRLPREAALAHCIVITNKSGAAQYDADVPIPSKYKIQHFNVDAIHRLLKISLEEYESRTKEFDGYREWIVGQEDRMKECVDKLVEEVVHKRKRQSL